jgi:predicted RNase H-like nuclease (RuvC/YqgF family)
MGKVMNSILILAIMGGLGYGGYQYTLTPCDTVLQYSIGRFDDNFGLSEAEFRKNIVSAEAPWEKAVGKNLFEYNPEAKFTLNLIYDERQIATVQKQRTESGLAAAELFFQNLDNKFHSIKSEYESSKNSYESAKNNFQSRTDAYEKEVERWNREGGAPKEKYNELERERNALNNEAMLLNKRAEELNRLSADLNAKVEERNRAAEDYNKVVESYNDKYGRNMEFDQAEYNGEAINVYQFSDSKSLVMALAHEFGHALHMDHVENSKSIMYYLRDSDNTLVTPIPTAEDVAELHRSCKL